MGRERTWLRLGGALVAVGLTAVGCSDADGDPTPTSGPTVSESPSEAPSSPEPTSPAPGPTPWPEPTRPAAMERDDVEGAKAAAEYFLALYPYVFATGDLEEWEAMSHPECRFCAVVSEQVSELHSNDGYGVGGVISIAEIGALPPDAEFSHYRIGVRGMEAPSSSYSAEGTQLESAEGGDVAYTLAVLPGPDWSIRGVAMEER